MGRVKTLCSTFQNNLQSRTTTSFGSVISCRFHVQYCIQVESIFDCNILISYLLYNYRFFIYNIIIMQDNQAAYPPAAYCMQSMSDVHDITFTIPKEQSSFQQYVYIRASSHQILYYQSKRWSFTYVRTSARSVPQIRGVKIRDRFGSFP